MEQSRERAYAVIDRSAIRHNYETIRSMLDGRCKIMSVVKADGYGHGAVQVAKTLSDSDYFGVACINEALELRNGGITAPILILGYTAPRDVETLIERNLTQCAFDSGYLAELNNCAAGKKLKIHLKIDTGMSRLGFYAHDTETAVSTADEIAQIMKNTPFLEYEGIFTHFTSSEQTENSDTEEQFSCFTAVLKKLEEKGITFPLRHCANSAATLLRPEMHLDMVRPGIALYGYAPDPEMDSFGLKPALELKARIAQVHRLKPGDGVSYNRTFRAGEAMDVATVCIGYGDGLHRALSNGSPVLVNGKKTEILGRICMDQSVVDTTGIHIAPGETVTLIGTDGDETLSAADLAQRAGTIHYEILCSIGKRIPRIYK